MVTVGDQLKVLDFGLAHVDSGESDSVSPTAERLTAFGSVVGTPGYMSPEQAEGRPLDARSDVFSLGVVLYEALTGRVPFRSTSVAGTLYEIVHRDPEPVRRVRPDVPRDLEEVLEGMLSKDPADRYANGTELLAALDGRPAARRPTGRRRGARSAGWLREHRAWAAAALLLAAGAGAFVALRGRSGGPDAGRAGVVETESPFALYRQGTEALARPWEPGRIEEATALFERAIARDPGYAPGYVGLAEATWRAYRRDRDRTQIQRALGYARQGVEAGGQLAIAHATLGLVALEAGEREVARQALDQALALEPANAGALRTLGRLLEAEGRPKEAEAAFTRAVVAAPDDGDLRVGLGAFLFTAGRYEEAEAAFREAARLSPDNPVPWSNLGGAQHMLGRFADAASSLQKSLEIAPNAVVYSNLGTAYFFQGLYPQAASAFEKAVELSPNNGTMWRNMADSYRPMAGREAESRDAYTRAAQLLREELEGRPDDASLRAELAVCLARLGRTKEALREVATVAASKPSEPGTLYSLALACEAAGSRDRALAHLARALELGYPVSEVRRDIELVELRKDLRYHRLVVRYEGDGDPAAAARER
jgi:serine/threonine-protein kinase